MQEQLPSSIKHFQHTLNTPFSRSGVGMPKYRSSGTGRRSVPNCVPTPERGNDSQPILIILSQNVRRGNAEVPL